MGGFNFFYAAKESGVMGKYFCAKLLNASISFYHTHDPGF